MAPQDPMDLQLENSCLHHNSFGFNRIFLKLADKVDMDKILNEFEKWAVRIIKQSYVPLFAKVALFDIVINITQSVVTRCS